jgi:signal transduction histidine kinase
LDARGKDYLRRLVSSAGRMDRLVQDVLDYSQIVRAELPIERVDIRALLTDIIETYPVFHQNGTKIHLGSEFPPVLGNQAALTQCISNLLTNAVRFVAPGVNPEVHVWSEMKDGWVRMLVKDNGIGIAPHHHERIFAMFQRLSKHYEGTGMGLAIVKKAAERMGARLGFDSAPGEGSTFWLELPVAEPVSVLAVEEGQPAILTNH